jgi:hypothetical protein
MDQALFHKWLRKQGRTEEVAKRVIRLAAVYAEFLTSQAKKTLDTAEPGNLEAFVEYVEQSDHLPTHDGIHPSAKSYLWAIRYYYQYTSQQQMAEYAARMREARITRKPFRLKDFRGVDPEQIAALEAVNIKHTDHILTAGKTPELRQSLSEKTGIPIEAITELVKLSDLARIAGMKGVRARLYHDAGVDTLEKLASWEPQALQVMLADFVERTNFEGIAPQPAEVLYSITSAQKLPKTVEYE